MTRAGRHRSEALFRFTEESADALEAAEEEDEEEAAESDEFAEATGASRIPYTQNGMNQSN